MKRWIIVKEPNLLNRYFIETKKEYQNGTYIFCSNLRLWQAKIIVSILNFKG